MSFKSVPRPIVIAAASAGVLLGFAAYYLITSKKKKKIEISETINSKSQGSPEKIDLTSSISETGLNMKNDHFELKHTPTKLHYENGTFLDEDVADEVLEEMVVSLISESPPSQSHSESSPISFVTIEHSDLMPIQQIVESDIDAKTATTQNSVSNTKASTSQFSENDTNADTSNPLIVKSAGTDAQSDHNPKSSNSQIVESDERANTSYEQDLESRKNLQIVESLVTTKTDVRVEMIDFDENDSHDGSINFNQATVKPESDSVQPEKKIEEGAASSSNSSERVDNLSVHSTDNLNHQASSDHVLNDPFNQDTQEIVDSILGGVLQSSIYETCLVDPTSESHDLTWIQDSDDIFDDQSATFRGDDDSIWSHSVTTDEGEASGQVDRVLARILNTIEEDDIVGTEEGNSTESNQDQNLKTGAVPKKSGVQSKDSSSDQKESHSELESSTEF